MPPSGASSQPTIGVIEAGKDADVIAVAGQPASTT